MNVAAKRAVEPALERFAARWRDRRRAAAGVADLQRRALDVAVAAGLPGARNEAFKYTSLRRFGTRTFDLPAPGPLLTADELDSRLLPASGWHRLVFIDGHYLPELSTPFPAARGVSVRALADVAITEPDGLADWLERDTGSETPFFAALNAAFVEDGLVIELEASAAIAEPVYVVHVSTARERATMSHTRVILDAGPHTRAILVEHHVAIGAAECYSNVVTDVQLGEHARIEHYRIQEESTAAFHFAQLRAVLADGAGLVDHRIALGAGLDRTDIAVRLDGPGAEVFLNGLFVVDGTRHVDSHTCVDHLAPRTNSEEDYRGLADDRGRGVFNGKVIVRPGAQQIEARQSSRNLLLAAGAEIDTKPELEIYADDVKCSHGATTGQLDPNALFYLRSRAIPEDEARALLTHAFAVTVIERIGLGPIREYLEQALLSRFRRQGDDR